MKKEELLALWNGKYWDSRSSGIYFIGHKFEQELQFNFSGYCEEDIHSIPCHFMEKLATKMNELDKKAHRIIEDTFHNENTETISLTDILFDASGCYNAFAFGYHVGESPAGELYFLVKFDDNFQPDSELIYEIY